MGRETSGGGKACKSTAERYRTVALEILKEAGVKCWIFHEKGLRGRGCARKKQILAPTPTTRRRLYVVAHEAAQVALNHRGSKPSHRQEYEAEVYAHEALTRHGIGITERDTAEAQKYVAYRIDQAVRMGKAKRLECEAVEWTHRYHGRATRAALKAGTVVPEIRRGSPPRRSAHVRKQRALSYSRTP